MMSTISQLEQMIRDRVADLERADAEGRWSPAQDSAARNLICNYLSAFLHATADLHFIDPEVIRAQAAEISRLELIVRRLERAVMRPDVAGGRVNEA